MQKFAIGNTVICIDNKGEGNPLILSASYKVQGLYTCVCGSVYLNVGIGNPKDNRLIFGCCNLKMEGLTIRWCREERFILEQQDQEAETAVNKLIKETSNN